MSRIICITYYEKSTPNSEKKLLVSHGVDEKTGKNIVLPNVPPASLGAFVDLELNEWVIYND